MLSVFIRNPQFQSQTKDRLTSPEATRLVENAVRDHFDHFLADNMERGKALMGSCWRRSTTGLRRKAEREVKRKTATSGRKVRLPGKLTDCANDDPTGTELLHRRRRQRGRFSQAGARPQDAGDIADPRQDPQRRIGHARTRSAPTAKSPTCNLALGCGSRKDCNPDNLRYERVIIMTDADVDGAHIATLLMTFFFQEMPEIVKARPSLPRPPAALPYSRIGSHIALRAGRRAPRRNRGDGVQGQECRCRALQGAWRDEPRSSCAKRRWTQKPAR